MVYKQTKVQEVLSIPCFVCGLLLLFWLIRSYKPYSRAHSDMFMLDMYNLIRKKQSRFG